MNVKQAMHAGVDWCAPDTPLSDIARVMRDADVGAVPIGENDRLIGMVTDRDIVCRGCADGRDPTAMTARDVMTSGRSEEHTSELQSLMRISYAVFCLNK